MPHPNTPVAPATSARAPEMSTTTTLGPLAHDRAATARTLVTAKG